jgi:hypothetical protein
MDESQPAAAPESEHQQLEWIPVDQLHLDPENPRLPPNVREGGEPAVFEWMLKKANVLELMGAIGQTDYFPGEPVLAARMESGEGYVVVEGNRRLTAAKLLLNPDSAPTKRKSVHAVATQARFKPPRLPALIYGHRSEILHYLGYRHITGVQEWDALEKARYLRQLVDTMAGDQTWGKYQAAARTIGSRADYVERLLTGLRVYEAIEADRPAGPEGREAEAANFAVLTTALSYRNIADFVGLEAGVDPSTAVLNMPNLRRLADWMYSRDGGKTRLGESRRLKELNIVVTHPAALTAFENGRSLVDAARLAGQPLAVFRISVFDAEQRLQEAKANLAHVEKLDPSDADNVGGVVGLAQEIQANVGRLVDPGAA